MQFSHMITSQVAWKPAVFITTSFINVMVAFLTVGMSAAQFRTLARDSTMLADMQRELPRQPTNQEGNSANNDMKDVNKQSTDTCLVPRDRATAWANIQLTLGPTHTWLWPLRGASRRREP